MDKELNILWGLIESLTVTPSLKANAIFNAGASLSDIETFERELGVNLPKDVVDSFQRHNGMPVENGYYCFWEGSFLSLRQSLKERSERILTTKRMFGEPGSPGYCPPESVIGPVKADVWLPLWVPVLKKNKEPVCIDFDPDDGGVVGQIIEVDWEGSEVKVIAKSYREFLKMVVENLQ